MRESVILLKQNFCNAGTYRWEKLLNISSRIRVLKLNQLSLVVESADCICESHNTSSTSCGKCVYEIMFSDKPAIKLRGMSTLSRETTGQKFASLLKRGLP